MNNRIEQPLSPIYRESMNQRK